MARDGQMLKGSKVILREKRLEDATSDYSWRCDPELARLDAASPMKSSFQDYLASYAEEINFPVPWQERFAIETMDGKHIGNCMYFDIDNHKREAELGILIGDRAYWAKGYGRDAVTTLLNYIFDTAGLERVYLHTLEWNIRAQKCFAKCGFNARRRVLKNGHRFILMEIHRDERDAVGEKASSESNTSPISPAMG
ncbi:MAG: GNAT family N-acetyltransferase [Chloroflexota bacterium]